MPHTVREKTKLLNRARRIRGQIEAVERALEEEKGCTEVLHIAVATRGAINSLVAEIIEGHIRMHVIDPAREPDAARARGARTDRRRAVLLEVSPTIRDLRLRG